MKRKRDLLHVENPIIKEENKSWATSEPLSLTRSVSPPPTSSHRRSKQPKSVTAQVEAGEKDVEDHLSFFSSKLLSASRSVLANSPRLDHQSWINLYTSNASSPEGHHFVIHQHDHPVAGTHYDLRLQCNETSSVSWAIMYGLPGDPNSCRLNRNATETRIHCLWNHLIETASHQTGTLLIWDTGLYEVLQYRETSTQSNAETTDEDLSEGESAASGANSSWQRLSEPEKLHRSFQNRRIRLRLHGTKLPENYTLSLWLRRQNDRAEQPAAPKTRRRKVAPSLAKQPSSKGGYNTDSDRDERSDIASVTATTSATRLRRSVSSLQRHESPPTRAEAHRSPAHPTRDSDAAHSDDNAGTPTHAQDELIRRTNAYPGATNSINSIHQRRWYLCLDRAHSGFVKPSTTGRWAAPSDLSAHADLASDATEARQRRPRAFEPFHVLGREHERSVVTGRLASQILADEGVVGYVPRGKWRAVTE